MNEKPTPRANGIHHNTKNLQSTDDLWQPYFVPCNDGPPPPRDQWSYTEYMVRHRGLEPRTLQLERSSALPDELMAGVLRCRVPPDEFKEPVTSLTNKNDITHAHSWIHRNEKNLR